MVFKAALLRFIWEIIYCMLLKKTSKKNGESLEKVARRKPEKAGESIQNSRRKPLLAPEKAKPEKARRKPEKAGECWWRKFGESVLRHVSHQIDRPDFLQSKRRRKPPEKARRKYYAPLLAPEKTEESNLEKASGETTGESRFLWRKFFL